MTSAASIKAGEAWVGIHGRMGNLPDVLAKARGQVSGWAGSVEQLGEKVAKKFGSSILGGIVGFTGAGAIDSALRSVADRMRQAVASGGTIGFADVGMAIGESIADGLKAIPIAGAIGELAAMAFDSALGSPMATEAAMAGREKIAKSRADAYAALAAESERLERLLQGPNASRDVADQSRSRINDAMNALMATGVPASNARVAASGAALNLDKFLEADADRKVKELLDTFDRMAGKVSASTDEVRRLEEEILGVAQAMREAGRSHDDIEGMTEALRGAAEAARKERDIRARQKSIDEIVKSIEADDLDFGKTQSQLIEEQLRQLGAKQDEIDRAVKAAESLEAKRKAASAVSTVVESMTATGTFSSGAFDPGSGLLETADSSRETARNTKRLVQLMERGGLVYGP